MSINLPTSLREGESVIQYETRHGASPFLLLKMYHSPQSGLCSGATQSLRVSLLLFLIAYTHTHGFKNR